MIPDKYPFLLSIPHGGISIPPYIRGKITLNSQQIFEDGDVYTDQIYNIPSAEKVIIQKTARVVLDMNRKEDDLPPKNCDGIVKTKNCECEQIYRNDLSSKEVNRLLDEIYHPFHNAIKHSLTNPEIIFAFDCHSMLPFSPIRDGTDQEKRPLVNLGNLDGDSCDNQDINVFASLLAKSFGISVKEVSLNKPFKGGWITQKYALNPLPWIQIELNRALYYGEDCYLFPIQESDSIRIRRLNNMLDTTFQHFAEYLMSN